MTDDKPNKDAIREAVEWLEMEALVFRTDGKEENAKMATHTADLIRRLAQ